MDSANDANASAPDAKSPLSTALTISVTPEAKAAPAAEPEAPGMWAFLGAFSRQSAVIAGAAVIAAVAGGAYLANGSAWHAAPQQATAARAEDEIKALRATVAQLSSDVKALRSANETTKTAAAQIGKLTERIDRVEHGQPDQAKLAKAMETIDKLDQKVAAIVASDATGSISTKPAPAAAQPPAPPAPQILSGWQIRRVYDGLALVQTRWGDVIEVGPGDILPGAVRVEDIRRQDGRWVVVTSRGLIVSSR